MNLSILLKPEAIRVVGTMGSKKRLFHELGEIASAAHGLRVDEAAEALMDREALGPTGVGQGVALPHARMRGMDAVKGVFLRIERPMEFNSVDRQPVDLVFALFAPEASGVDHLKALASVSRAFRNGDLCSKLRANTDAASLHAILTSAQSIRAA